jgi:hypothetical protein
LQLFLLFSLGIVTLIYLERAHFQFGKRQCGSLGNSPQAWPQGSKSLKKNHCAFCHQEEYWRSECPLLQPRHREIKEIEVFVGLTGLCGPMIRANLPLSSLAPKGPWSIYQLRANL